jgi:hypothetical protein
MRKFFLAGLLAAASLAILPERSNAWGKDPYWNSGFGTLGSMAFNHMRWIHSQGPLYNYGPYNGPGHVQMHIPKPYHGTYQPADPSLWGQGGYGYGNGYGAAPQYAPAIQSAPTGNCNSCAARPAMGQPGQPGQPMGVPATLPNIPPQNIGYAPQMMMQQQRVLPASYDRVYPMWLNYR